MLLYHATYRARLAGIKEGGLGAHPIKNWGISEPGVTYLCSDPDAAFSFCEVAEDVSDSVYESGIVVLAVSSKYLDKDKLSLDANYHEDGSGPRCFVYKGVIPASQLMVVTIRGLKGFLLNMRRVLSYENSRE